MPKWFTDHELNVLDALTANNPAVLVSFGGTPAALKDTKEEGVTDLGRLPSQRNGSQDSRGQSVVRQRGGNLAR
jgi:hypothetical protein